MKKIFFVLAVLIAFSSGVNAKDDPKANPEAVVVSGNARFTVLADRLVRMEWSADGVFEDNATLGIVNRKLPVPAFKSRRSGNRLTITTSELTLVYVNDGKAFSKDNLSVSFTMPASQPKSRAKKYVWTPGSDASGNLLGTARTLDRCATKADVLEKGMDPGVVSRDGWALIDESARHLLVPDDTGWENWVAPRKEGERQDWYLFAYGHDYIAAVKAYAAVGGRVPLPPRYTFGFWQSRYWAYSDYEFINMAKRFRSENIPADVMIIDMDWHTLGPFWNYKKIPDLFNQRTGWTGYTWNEKLFPDPDATLAQLHDLKFKTALNLHPSSGIQPTEDKYDAFVADYISRTDTYDGPKGYVFPEGGYKYVQNSKAVGKAGDKAPVAYRLSEKAFTESYFKTVLHPIAAQGVDFWWLDWQQWLTDYYVKDLNMTFWHNYVFFKDMARQSASQGIYAARPFTYHRWGGLGSHRYPLGFSGDTFVAWSALEMTPWFTSTASNVCYGYWGHDIGGHMGGGELGRDPEIFTRWLQFGVFTPIFKVHSSKTSDIERRFWNYPDYFELLKEAVRLRYALSPYIYDMARNCTETGLSMCRPLYWYAPEEENSYTYENEYFFGDNVLATVVAHPADSTGLATVDMWFPEGSDWYDMSTGMLYKGGTQAALKYALNENPWFVRAGGLVPMAGENLSNLQTPTNALKVLVAPGEGDCEYVTFEDDGSTQAYDTEYASTRITKNATASSTVVTVYPREGSYKGISPTRRLSFAFEGVYAPTKVTVNGEEIPFRYDGLSLSAEVVLPEMPASEKVIVECAFDTAADKSLLRGKKGIFNRCYSITDKLKSYWSNPSEVFLDIASCPTRISSHPEKAQEILSSMNLEGLRTCWDKENRLPEKFKLQLRHLTDF